VGEAKDLGDFLIWAVAGGMAGMHTKNATKHDPRVAHYLPNVNSNIKDMVSKMK
jgi:hypothetical protein